MTRWIKVALSVRVAAMSADSPSNTSCRTRFGRMRRHRHPFSICNARGFLFRHMENGRHLVSRAHCHSQAIWRHTGRNRQDLQASQVACRWDSCGRLAPGLRQVASIAARAAGVPYRHVVLAIMLPAFFYAGTLMATGTLVRPSLMEAGPQCSTLITVGFLVVTSVMSFTVHLIQRRAICESAS